jgi:hypothetical protein
MLAMLNRSNSQPLATLQAFIDKAESQPENVDGDELTALRALAEHVIPKAQACRVRRFMDSFGWPITVLTASGLLSLVAVLLREGFSSGLVIALAPAQVALMAATVWATLRMWRMIDLDDTATEALSLAEPLAQLEGTQCEQALNLVQASSAAKALRDTVVSRGEELCRFHLCAMAAIVEKERARERSEAEAKARRAACQELHGVAASSPSNSQ